MDSNLQYDRWLQHVSWRKNLRGLFIIPDSEVPGTGVLIEYGCWKTRFRANSKLNKKLLKPARRKCWGWCPWLIPRICGDLEAGDVPCASLSAWTHSLSWFLIQASHCLAKEKQKAQKQKENASHFSWKMRQLCKILTLKMEVYQFAPGLKEVPKVPPACRCFSLSLLWFPWLRLCPAWEHRGARSSWAQGEQQSKEGCSPVCLSTW